METNPLSHLEIKNDPPKKIAQWNWGAFFIPLFWGIGHRCPWALLCFIPFGGPLLASFTLGFIGNKWAWDHRDWKDEQVFHQVQRTWAIAGLILFIFKIGILYYYVTTNGSFSFTLPNQAKTTATVKKPKFLQFAKKINVQKAVIKEVMQNLSGDGEIYRELGEPLQAGKIISQRKVKVSDYQEAYFAEIPVSGSFKKATVYVEALVDTGVVVIKKLVVYFSDPPRKIWQVPYRRDAVAAA